MSLHSRSARLPSRSPSGQGGFALVTALIFLLLITMLAVSASQRSMLQQRMAGSLRNAQQARMSAETALRGVEYMLWSIATRPGMVLHCLDGRISEDDGCIIYRPLSAPYAAKGEVTVFRNAPGWVTGIGKTYEGPSRGGYTGTHNDPAAALARNPVYLIEDLGREPLAGAGGPGESGNTGPGNSGADRLNLHVYRITTRGAGGHPDVVSVVQSTFVAPASP